MAEEVVEHLYLAILDEYEVRMEMQLIPIYDANDSSPLYMPESKNQGGAMYNSDWGYDGISGGV